MSRGVAPGRAYADEENAAEKQTLQFWLFVGETAGEFGARVWGEGERRVAQSAVGIGDGISEDELGDGDDDDDEHPEA